MGKERGELVQGTLDMLILKTLTRGPMHGYAIAEHLRSVSDDVLQVGESSLYPALQRLLKDELVAVFPEGEKGMGKLWKDRYKLQRFGRGVGMALVAAGGVAAGIVYVARKKIASVATVIYQGGRRLLGRAITTLASMMPSFVFGGT